jgi:putative transposase
MAEHRHSAHATFDLKYRVIWITKYRYKILRGRIAERTRDLIRQVCQARKLQEEFPELRKRYWGQHLWARGYFCATVGAMDEQMIKAYIENQKWTKTTWDSRSPRPPSVVPGNPDLVDTLRVEPHPFLHASFYVDGRSDSGAGLLSHSGRSSDGGARSLPSTQGFAALGEASEADRCGLISLGPFVAVLDRLAVCPGDRETGDGDRLAP